MKKLFLLFLLILCPAVFAEEEIYLDKQITPQNIYSKMNNNPYASHSTSFSSEKKFGNFTIGTKSDYSFSPDKYTQSGTLFTKYQKNKFSFDTSYKNKGFTSLNKPMNGVFSFTPEYKLNSHLTLQNVYSTSFLDKNKKNELIFSIRPFKDDRMNFDIGAGQIYSDNTAPVRSQLNFSTKFKF